MAIELVTGYQGQDHVTAEQWADFNRGIFGDAAILPIGNRMETAIQTANQITVKDGVAVFDGREVYIGYGETESIAITSGTQGMLRRDIVVVEYTREEETGVESVQFKVINGTPAASNAQDPSVQDMDIRTGVFVSQKPFCRVRLNGTAIEGVDSLVSVKKFKDHAFSDPVNNLTGTDSALALAAPQGRALKQLIDQLNSALSVKTEVRNEGANLNVYQAVYGNIAQVRAASNLKATIPSGEKRQLYQLNIEPVYAIYRRYPLTGTTGYIIDIDSDGILYITPFGGNLAEGSAINFTEVFLTK